MTPTSGGSAATMTRYATGGAIRPGLCQARSSRPPGDRGGGLRGRCHRARGGVAQRRRAGQQRARERGPQRPAGLRHRGPGGGQKHRHATSSSPRPRAAARPRGRRRHRGHLAWAGNPDGHATVPAAGLAVDTSHPDHVIGNGSPAGCTSAAVVQAVAEGGIITFDCGPSPVTITMTATAKVVNTSHQVVLDGGGKVTLSGGGSLRILYMNTCDAAQTYTTSDCWEQQWPQLVVQNMTFTDAYSATMQSSTPATAAGPSSTRAASSRWSTPCSPATSATPAARTSAAGRSAPPACTCRSRSTSPMTPSPVTPARTAPPSAGSTRTSPSTTA